LNFSGHRIGDLLITTVFGFQGLLTFSRGGIFVGVLAIALIYFLSILNKKADSSKKKKIPFYYILLMVMVGLFTFLQVDRITEGMLTLRYQGETEGTLIGYKEKNFNVITTNRFAILLGDLELWQEHLLGGVGVGASKYLRTPDTVNPHIEMSRLLAEHGIPGLLYFGIFVFLGLRLYKQKIEPQIRTILLALFLVGFLTSFHSAMRTYITPLLISLSTITPLNLRNKK
jgi:O-antigen ligase